MPQIETYHVFGLTYNGPHARRTGGFFGVDQNPAFTKGAETLVTGPEAKLIAQRAHEENEAVHAENARRGEENAKRALAKPPQELLPTLVVPFTIRLVSEPQDGDGSSFQALMAGLKAPAAVAAKKSVSRGAGN